MSARGSSPKIVSDTVTEPDSLPSREVTFSSISRPLAFGGSRRFRNHRRSGRGLAELELARLRYAGRQLLLHRVAHRDPAALDARHRTFDQDEAALDVGLHDFQIERRHPIDAEVTGHFLVLEGFAGILAAAGRTDRAVRNGDAVAGAQAAEIPALHAAGPALTGRGAGHVDILADEEVVSGDLSADRNNRIGVDAKFSKLALGLDLGDREIAAVGLGGALHFAHTGAKLERDIAILLFGAVRDDLTIAEPQHRHRHVLASLGEEAGHPDFLCQHSGTHWNPFRALELDLDVDTGGKIELHQRVHRLRRRIDDIEQALVRAHFELLAALLVDMRRAVDGELLDPRRQRNRPANLRTGALGGIDDLARRRIEDAVIERLEPDAYILAVHFRLFHRSLPGMAFEERRRFARLCLDNPDSLCTAAFS